jgi:RTX calcium-binding nonapeptide repeat (4 copies)/WD40-like Beta Propeller Repeat
MAFGAGVSTSGAAAAPQPLARPPAAGGIVFARGNDVWITSSDGSNERRLTFNGTSAAPWLDPSMTADGTIFAIRNRTVDVGRTSNRRGTIYRLNQAGKISGSITPPQFDSRDNDVTRGLGITAIAASPSGTRIAYQHSWLCPDPVHVGFDTLCSFTEVAWADGSDNASVGHRASLGSMETPSWANETTLLLSKRAAGVSFYRYGTDLNGGEPRPWFGYGDVDLQYDADFGPKRLAVVGRFEKANGPVEGLWLLEVNDRVPANPDPKCLITGAGGAFQDPSWSPDGQWLTYAVSDSDRVAPEPIGEGVWVAKIGYFATGCAITTVGGRAPIVADGERPEWGAKFYAAARRDQGRNTFTYLAGSPAMNNVTIAPSGNAYAIYDRSGHTIALGDGCARFSAAVVSCGPRGAAEVVAWGYDGDDRISAAVGVPATLRGGADNDTLFGGSHADHITGGRGRDRLLGNAGADVIDARDGAVDRINCGGGRDTVLADASDDIRNCERVHR